MSAMEIISGYSLVNSLRNKSVKTAWIMKTIRWTARILTGVAILFMFMIYLDVFEGSGSSRIKITDFVVTKFEISSDGERFMT
jgi:hypothetical protein